MSKIQTKEALLEAILLLEQKQTEEMHLLKHNVNGALNALRPANLIKRTVRDLAGSEDFKENLLVAAAGITTGFIAKLIIERNNESAFNKLLSAASQYGITNYIANHPEEVKAVAQYVIESLKRE